MRGPATRREDSFVEGGQAPQDAPMALLGGDRDEYGCIPSAGYHWCETKAACLRSFDQPCGSFAMPLLGSDRDEHGCIPSAGYHWCEAKGKCLRPWEERCEAASECDACLADELSVSCRACLMGASPLEFCALCTGQGLNDVGCKRCEASAKPLAPMVLVGGDKDKHGCIPSAGYRWCETKGACLQSWEQRCEDVAKTPEGVPANLLDGGEANAMKVCTCPPAEVLWKCGPEEYHALRNGTTCPFYRRQGSSPHLSATAEVSP